MTRFEAFRHAVLLPALGSQIIIVMLGSAACSQIATDALNFAANFIQSRNFRAFETCALSLSAQRSWRISLAVPRTLEGHSPTSPLRHR